MPKIFLLTFFLSSCISYATAHFIPENILNPHLSTENSKFCGRESGKTSVCDPKGYLTLDDRNAIEGYINAAAKYAQMGVVIIDKMSPIFMNRHSVDAASEIFAKQVHDVWGVGDKEKNNGILIFLSIQDRAVYISRGVGVANLLTGSTLDAVITAMKPFLRDANYGHAIERCVVELTLLLSGKRQIDFPDNYSSPFMEFLSNYWVFGVLLGLCGFNFYMSNSMKKMEKGQKALEKFVKEVRDAKDNKFTMASCPICLEDFPTTAPAKTLDNGYNTATDVCQDEEVKAGEPSSEATVTIEVENPTNGETTVPPSKSGLKLDPRRPMALSCGHVYCFTCLEHHMKTSQQKDKCPICREDIDPVKRDDKKKASTRTNTATGHPPAPRASYPSTSGGDSCADNFTDHSTTSTENSTQTRHRNGSSSPLTTTQRIVNSSLNWLEWNYRLNRLRYFYPNVIDRSTYGALSQAIRTQNADDLLRVATIRQSAVNSIVTDYRTRQAAVRSGRNGSSFSFGGGRSSGGGGGRW